MIKILVKGIHLIGIFRIRRKTGILKLGGGYGCDDGPVPFNAVSSDTVFVNGLRKADDDVSGIDVHCLQLQDLPGGLDVPLLEPYVYCDRTQVLREKIILRSPFQDQVGEFTASRRIRKGNLLLFGIRILWQREYHRMRAGSDKGLLTALIEIPVYLYRSRRENANFTRRCRESAAIDDQSLLILHVQFSLATQAERGFTDDRSLLKLQRSIRNGYVPGIQTAFPHADRHACNVLA